MRVNATSNEFSKDNDKGKVINIILIWTVNFLNIMQV